MSVDEDEVVVAPARLEDQPAHDRDREHWTIPYLYRDASNYKAFGGFIVEAPTDAVERQQLIDRMVAATDPTIVDGGFVPADVGLDMLHGDLAEYSDGLIDDDHPWHELLVGKAEAVVIADAATAVPLEELVARFESAAAHGWPSASNSLSGVTGLDWREDHGSSD